MQSPSAVADKCPHPSWLKTYVLAPRILPADRKHMQSPRLAEAEAQLCFSHGRRDDEHPTYVYLNFAPPFQRHLLQLSRNRRVRILYGPEFNYHDSQWHGEHSMINGSDREWSITMHYMGDRSDFFRHLRVEKDFPGSYNVYQNGQRCAYLVEIDFYTTEDAQEMLRPR